jgi:hypothetical protein
MRGAPLSGACPESAGSGGDPLANAWRKGSRDANREGKDRLVRMVTKESSGFGRINRILDFVESEEIIASCANNLEAHNGGQPSAQFVGIK